LILYECITGCRIMLWVAMDWMGEGFEFESWWRQDISPVIIQISSGVHPTIPTGKASGMMLTTHLLLPEVFIA
jgi:hypothetical protein